MTPTSKLSGDIRQYFIITGNYWAFTLTDGALRMLVILHFHGLGYSPIEIAMMFIFYEIFGVITNLVGGWLGAKIGLNKTMNIGLILQIFALSMLLVPADLLSVAWVMVAQAISGIAKDLNKMSAKSAIKLIIADNEQGKLYKWVAILTGSKNALKGVGFFLGGVLLAAIGFQDAIGAMLASLFIVWVFSLIMLQKDLGKAKIKPKFSQIFSKSRAINILSAARLFLFGARDIWFVIALPIYLSTIMGWDHFYVGSFLALWVIGYGFVQSIAPLLTRPKQDMSVDGRMAMLWAIPLALIPALMAFGLDNEVNPPLILAFGLILFGVVFAVNSSLHSYLILAYAGEDGVSLDVGFYYMANAMGRLVGTVLSGWIFQTAGLEACLYASSVFIGIAVLFSIALPKHQRSD